MPSSLPVLSCDVPTHFPTNQAHTCPFSWHHFARASVWHHCGRSILNTRSSGWLPVKIWHSTAKSLQSTTFFDSKTLYFFFIADQQLQVTTWFPAAKNASLITSHLKAHIWKWSNDHQKQMTTKRKLELQQYGCSLISSFLLWINLLLGLINSSSHEPITQAPYLTDSLWLTPHSELTLVPWSVVNVTFSPVLLIVKTWGWWHKVIITQHPHSQTSPPAEWAWALEYTDSLSALRPPPNECPVYDIKQPDGEAPVLEIWGMWSTPSLPLFPGLLLPGVVGPDRVLSMNQIELFDIQTMCKQMTYAAKLNC